MRFTWVSILAIIAWESISFFFFSSRRRHTRSKRDWSSDVCSSDLAHADGSVDVENFGRLDQFSRGGILVLHNIDALRRTFFLADFAGDAAHAIDCVGAVVNQERHVAGESGDSIAAFGVLDGREALD